ncbi:MAG: dTDP-4-amino-4,6-dideoxygalactose transaminase [Acidobacteriota bacterium]
MAECVNNVLPEVPAREGNTRSTVLRPIPFSKPYIAGNELKYLAQAVATGEIGSDGRYTQACAQLLKQRLNIPQVLMVSSGTAALEMAAMLCGLAEGDEVILPSFTFTSTANAIMRTGAKPVFVDIREDTLNLDESLVEARITRNTKAIFPIHYAGVSCEMDSLMDLARRHDLLVVEDAAQAVNSSFKGRACGSIGALGAFSFHSTKNYSCGEGGALCISAPEFAARAEVIRDKGTNRAKFLRSEVDKYTWVDVGSSYLPSELSSAYLLAQLEMMDCIKFKRQTIYQRYHELLIRFENQEFLRLPRVPVGCDTNCHAFYILLPDQAMRDRLLVHFSQHEIRASLHYVPLHLSPMGSKLGYSRGDFAVTEDLSGRLLRLPFYTDLTEEDQIRIADSMHHFFGNLPPTS